MFLQFIVERDHKEAFLELAHRIAKSDGFVNRNESTYIRGWMNELGLDDWEPNTEAQLSTAELVGNLQDEQLKRIFIAEMLLLILVDGNYNDEEKRIANEMKELFGCNDQTFDKFRNWVEQMNKLKVEGMKLVLHGSN
ncbi:TerB family tellurite resistance protein [Paenibacillus sp. L3-i20]|uniref:tellurite resistance TerB family protein n=1 Tax=Paenibacillus sp. L3-i20 TaxID=2905833 RepID=UPI001EDEB46D|nr:TerB family tellurite resistance protein [Paenibacillus sp. L3-i20]GKU76564.1 hypothetical protein L3i20_v209610 [Paenibacillus sp. L3-i20]